MVTRKSTANVSLIVDFAIRNSIASIISLCIWSVIQTINRNEKVIIKRRNRKLIISKYFIITLFFIKYKVFVRINVKGNSSGRHLFSVTFYSDVQYSFINAKIIQIQSLHHRRSIEQVQLQCYHRWLTCESSTDVISGDIGWRTVCYNAHIRVSSLQCDVSCGFGNSFGIVASYRKGCTRILGNWRDFFSFESIISQNNQNYKQKVQWLLPQMSFRWCVNPCERHACYSFCTIYYKWCIGMDAHFCFESN